MNPKVIAGIVVGVLVVLSLPLLLANKVTLNNYKEIQMGMTYDQVQGILGSGKTLAEVAEEEGPADLPPGMPAPDPKQMQRMLDAMGLDVYLWKRSDEKAVSVTFVDGKVASKAQVGLADQPSYEVDQNAIPGMADFGSMPGMPPTGR